MSVRGATKIKQKYLKTENDIAARTSTNYIQKRNAKYHLGFQKQVYTLHPLIPENLLLKCAKTVMKNITINCCWNAAIRQSNRGRYGQHNSHETNFAITTG
jgi:hypothetical protein